MFIVNRLCMSYSLLPSVNKARRCTSEKVFLAVNISLFVDLFIHLFIIPYRSLILPRAK